MAISDGADLLLRRVVAAPASSASSAADQQELADANPNLDLARADRRAPVWKAYNIYVAIEKGQVDHTPAVYIVDGRGRVGYPVALDETGRVADGYGVQDQPWFVPTSASGKILWKHDGWLPVSQVAAAVRHAVG